MFKIGHFANSTLHFCLFFLINIPFPHKNLHISIKICNFARFLLTRYTEIHTKHNYY